MLSKTELEELYIKQNLTSRKIAEQLGVGKTTILRWLKKYNITSKKNGSWQGSNANYNDFFNVIDTPEKAYWLGFIAGDGCIYSSLGDSGIIRYTLAINLNSKDIEHLYSFAYAIGATKKSVRSYISPPRPNGKTSPMATIKSGSQRLCQDLQKHGITPRKAHTITGDVIPYGFELPFILGLFDADGTIVINNRQGKTIDSHWSITGNKPLMDSVAKELGIKNGVIIPSGRKSAQVYIGGRFKAEKILSKLYESCPVFLKRKHEKYLYLAQYNKSNPRFETNEEIVSLISEYLNSGVRPVQIAKILNKKGIKPRLSEFWTRSSIYRVLQKSMPSEDYYKIVTEKSHDKTNRVIIDLILELRGKGLTFKAIADELNKRKIETYYGSIWRANSVHSICKRHGA